MPPTCGVGGTASSGEGGSFWRGACGRRCPERPPRRAARQVCPRPVPFGGLLGADTAAETQVLGRRGRRHAKAATEASSPFENAVRARRSARRAGLSRAPPLPPVALGTAAGALGCAVPPRPPARTSSRRSLGSVTAQRRRGVARAAPASASAGASSVPARAGLGHVTSSHGC